MSFGPTNVAPHDVAVLIESGDPKGAIRYGVAVDPSGLASLERQGGGTAIGTLVSGPKGRAVCAVRGVAAEPTGL
jgi:hypothetical protein